MTETLDPVLYAKMKDLQKEFIIDLRKHLIKLLADNGKLDPRHITLFLVTSASAFARMALDGLEGLKDKKKLVNRINEDLLEFITEPHICKDCTTNH